MPPEPGPRPDTLEKKAKANQPLASDEAAAAITGGRDTGVGSRPLMKVHGDLTISTSNNVLLTIEDDWRRSKTPHLALPFRWCGRTEFEVSDGTWRSIEHRGWRRALMTPTGVVGLKLPAGLEWTGWRLTHLEDARLESGAGSDTD